MDRRARLGEHAIVTLHFTPHKLRSEQAHVIKIGKIASDAAFPEGVITIPQGMQFELTAGTQAQALTSSQVRMGA